MGNVDFVSAMRENAKWKSVAGVVSAFVTAFFYTMDGILVKKVDHLKPIELVFWRMLIQTLILMPICLYRHTKRYPAASLLGFVVENRPIGLKLMLMRGVVGTATLLLLFVSFSTLPLGDVLSLASASVWTCLISFACLGEKIHALDLVAIPISLTGIVCLAKPSFIFGDVNSSGFAQILGVVCALLAAVCIATTMNILRHIGQRIHFTVVTCYNGVVTIIITGTVMCFTGFSYPCLNQLVCIVFCGISAVLAQVFLIVALQLEKAARVAIVHQSQILFAFCIQIFYIGEGAELLSLIGASLILASSI